MVFGRTRFFPGLFWKDTVKFCGDNQFLPRAKPVKHEQAKDVSEECTKGPSSQKDVGYRAHRPLR